MRFQFLVVMLLIPLTIGCRQSAAKTAPIVHHPPKSGTPQLFREVATETGLDFHHFTGATGEFYMPEIMGSGVAVFDYDGDGDLDVHLVQGKLLNPSHRMSDALFPLPDGQPPGNRLFRNEIVPMGVLKFTDVTEATGGGVVSYGMGVAVGDYDNDGDPDLYVTSFGRNVLLRNDGARFVDLTREAGVDDSRWSTSASFLDYNRDGYLDLFVTNYVGFTVKGNVKCRMTAGELDYCTPAAYLPMPSSLFLNLKNGRFRNVTGRSGIGNRIGPGLGVSAADFDGDGWQDLLVANDGAANFLWINQRNGTFLERGLSLGVAYSANGESAANMGLAAGDFDNDRDEDFFVTHLIREGAVLYQNDGRGYFDDVTRRFGLQEATVSYTGFGTDWFDYDNDGFLDLFISNGAVTVQNSSQVSRYPFDQRNQLIRNQGGHGFRDVSDAAGAALRLSEVSRGAAYGDLDNDGDVDIVVSNNNGPARVLLNENRSGHWLIVRLQGTKTNRMGIGARVAVFRKGKPTLWRRVHTDSSYLSASDCRVHFGLGKSTSIDRVQVHWPDGTRDEWRDVAIDRQWELVQGTGAAR